VLLPMMVVSVLAVATAHVLQKDSMYVESLRSAGIVWEKTPEATSLASLKVSDIMRRDVTLIPRTTPLPEIVAAFLRSRSLFLYVGDEQGRLEGVLDIHNIKESFTERELSGVVVAADLVTEIPFATPDEPLTSVNEKLWFRDAGQLPVVDGPETRRFLGIVTQRDLLGAFDSEVLKRSRLLARVRTVGGEAVDPRRPGEALRAGAERPVRARRRSRRARERGRDRAAARGRADAGGVRAAGKTPRRDPRGIPGAILF
jgi:CIC family chloride channel protein